MNNLESANDLNKLNNFEKQVNGYFLSFINNKIKIKTINENYNKFNDTLLNLNFQMLKAIIQQNFDPSLYQDQTYPDIRFYNIFNIYDIKTFIKVFNSNNENKSKYVLINTLINTDSAKK